VSGGPAFGHYLQSGNRRSQAANFQRPSRLEEFRFFRGTRFRLLPHAFGIGQALANDLAHDLAEGLPIVCRAPDSHDINGQVDHDATLLIGNSGTCVQ
jgi:hypothetical protein